MRATISGDAFVVEPLPPRRNEPPHRVHVPHGNRAGLIGAHGPELAEHVVVASDHGRVPLMDGPHAARERPQHTLGLDLELGELLADHAKGGHERRRARGAVRVLGGLHPRGCRAGLARTLLGLGFELLSACELGAAFTELGGRLFRTRSVRELPIYGGDLSREVHHATRASFARPASGAWQRGHRTGCAVRGTQFAPHRAQCECGSAIGVADFLVILVVIGAPSLYELDDYAT